MGGRPGRRRLPSLAALGLLFVLLVAPAHQPPFDLWAPPAAAAAGDTDLRVQVVRASATADPEGVPFGALVDVQGPANATVELRAWVGGAGAVLTRQWTGVAWARGDRYALTAQLDEVGAWRGTVALRVHEPPEALGSTELTVRARVRDGDGEAAARMPIRLVSWGDLAGAPTPPGARVALQDHVVAPVVDGWALVPTGRVVWQDGAGTVVAEGVVSVPDVRVARVVPGRDVVVLAGEGSLAGVCVLDACFPANATIQGERRVPVEVPDRRGRVEITLGPRVLDAFAWADAPANAVVGPGLPPGFREGWTQVPAAPLEVAGTFHAYATPEGGAAVLLDALDRAAARVDVEVYTLTSPDLAAALARAADRGVRVRVLLDGSPVGGVPDGQGEVVAGLLARGVEVHDAPAGRYVTAHAKFAVVDGETLLVGSENWKPGAYPPAGGPGSSHGWGVAVANASLARVFEAVFAADWNGSVPVDARLLPPPAPLVPGPGRPRAVGAPVVAEATVRPVFSPDAPFALVGLLENATRSVDVQQLRVQSRFGTGPNPFLEALVAAAERGVRVRVLLDDSYNDPDNRAVVDRLRHAADARGLPLEVRTWSGPGTLHNKGVLVDGRVGYVGSFNWVQAAAERNREAGLIVASADVVAPWVSAFERDWRGPAPVTEDRPGWFALAGGAGVLASGVAVGRVVARRKGWRLSVWRE